MKKIKYFIFRVLETIAIAFIIIFSVDMLVLVFEGWHINEVYCKVATDQHDEGFYPFIAFIIVSFIIGWYVKRKYRKQT